MKKKWIVFSLLIVLVLSVGAIAYAAAGGYPMSYLPGTADTVTAMPADDSGTGGEAYTVSSQVPQRAGYEFIDWTLDYGQSVTLTYQVTGDPTYGKPGDATEPGKRTCSPGEDVTLAQALSTAWQTPDGSPLPSKESYEVNYRELGTNKVLAHPKVVADVSVGSSPTEVAIAIDGYTVCGATSQTITIRTSTGRWTFTGWCSDEACTVPVTGITDIRTDTTVYGKWEFEWNPVKNEIVFYYEEQPEPSRVSYTVRYIDIDTNLDICPPSIREGIELGETIEEWYREIPGYIIASAPWITAQITDDNMVFIFVYFEEEYPVN